MGVSPLKSQKGTEAELLEGMEVRCLCGKLYRLRWKRQLRGGQGGFVQEIVRKEKGEALDGPFPIPCLRPGSSGRRVGSGHRREGVLRKEEERMRSVAKEYLCACSLDGVRFRKDVTSDTVDQGGMGLKGRTIYFDPKLLDITTDRSLAFILGHELGEMWFNDAYEELLQSRMTRLRSQKGRDLSAKELTGAESDLCEQHDTYADEFAIRMLYWSGWQPAELIDCLASCRSLLQRYSEEHGKGTEVTKTLRRWCDLTSDRCQVVWREFQKSESLTPRMAQDTS